MNITLFLLLVSAFFLLLWVADIFFTLRSVAKQGRQIEANPVMRFLFGLRRTYFWIFKVAELSAFLVLIYLISFRDASQAVTILFSVIVIYTLVVAQGINVYLEVVRKATAVIILFVALSLLSVSFLWVNYSNFLNTGVISQELTKCGTEYANLYSQCISKTLPQNVTNRSQTNDLNLTIPR
jgi:hypothetical protein